MLNKFNHLLKSKDDLLALYETVCNNYLSTLLSTLDMMSASLVVQLMVCFTSLASCCCFFLIGSAIFSLRHLIIQVNDLISHII